MKILLAKTAGFCYGVKRAVEFLIFAANQQEKQESELGYVERAKTYILENSDKLLTVRDVSEYISLNPEYFTRIRKVVNSTRQ